AQTETARQRPPAKKRIPEKGDISNESEKGTFLISFDRGGQLAVEYDLAQAHVADRPGAATGGHQSEPRRVDRRLEPMGVDRGIREQVRPVLPRLLRRVPPLEPD